MNIIRHQFGGISFDGKYKYNVGKFTSILAYHQRSF
jgi:hypothetical protein